MFYQAEDYFFSAISKKCLASSDQIKVYLTGVNAESLNLLILKENLKNPPISLLPYGQIFLEQELPWSIVIPENYSQKSLEEILKTLDFSPEGNSENAVAMFIDLKQLPSLQKPKLSSIKNMDNNLDEWMYPSIEAFASTYEITNQYKKNHERALANKAQFWHFSFYVDKTPVSSLTLSLHNDLARIDDLGTLPSYQKQGFATELVHFALEQAKNLKANYCFLEASESGLSLYKKIGFKSLFKRQYFGK